VIGRWLQPAIAQTLGGRCTAPTPAEEALAMLAEWKYLPVTGNGVSFV
jgi:hypothetical protein